MGKSATSAMFRELGVPVLDSDHVVHLLYAPGGAAVPLVEAAFPGVVIAAAINRPLLSKQVVGNPTALKRLESIVHPLVQLEKKKFIQTAAAAVTTTPLVLLDIPLLYETQAETQCDAVVVVSAPASLQQQRVLAREGMTLEKLNAILQRQLPDEEKRQRADYVIDTSVSLEETRKCVVALVEELKGRGEGGEAYKLFL